MGDFWEEMQGAFSVESAIDHHLSERKIGDDHSTALQRLTERYRNENALPLPQEAGARVQFQANLGAVLTYENSPADLMEGTVVTVRTAVGDATHYKEQVMVLWDDGKFRPIFAQHLRSAPGSNKKASSVRIVASSLGDISALFSQASGGRVDELVHHATKDLWSFKQNDEGQFVIERLFDESGEPLKV